MLDRPGVLFRAAESVASVDEPSSRANAVAIVGALAPFGGVATALAAPPLAAREILEAIRGDDDRKFVPAGAIQAERLREDRQGVVGGAKRDSPSEGILTLVREVAVLRDEGGQALVARRLDHELAERNQRGGELGRYIEARGRLDRRGLGNGGLDRGDGGTDVLLHFRVSLRSPRKPRRRYGHYIAHSLLLE